MLGTNRKLVSEDAKSQNAKESTKLTQEDFKTTYVSKIAPEKNNDVLKKETDKNKMVDLANDQYEVVDTSYVYIQLKQK